MKIEAILPIEITLYNGSPLFNIAAVMTTNIDSTAIVYDAGLTSKEKNWETVNWADVYDRMQMVPCNMTDTSISQAVKYRTIIGNNAAAKYGAAFPAPQIQYFIH